LAVDGRPIANRRLRRLRRRAFPRRIRRARRILRIPRFSSAAAAVALLRRFVMTLSQAGAKDLVVSDLQFSSMLKEHVDRRCRSW
jgi:hypothetical protein